jgi:hypothetical protein
MVDREALAVQILQLQPRARPPNWAPVTVTEVADMLRQARVREPWHDPELGCYALAQSINNPLGYQALGRRGKAVRRLSDEPGVDDGRLVRTKASRARAAIEELRRALPDAIAAFENSLAESFTLHSWSADQAQELRAIQDLPLATARCKVLKEVLTLLEALPPRQTQRKKAWWRLDAAKIWELYRTTIDVSAVAAVAEERRRDDVGEPGDRKGDAGQGGDVGAYPDHLLDVERDHRLHRARP